MCYLIIYGFPFHVNSNVLIPRQETEELVAWIIDTAKNDKTCILDIGTGSGCIPVSLKKKISKAEIHAVDISVGALDLAKENALLNNVDIDFIELDILNENEWSNLRCFLCKFLF